MRFGMSDLEDCQPAQLFLGVTDELAETFVRLSEPPVRTD
jgi:hypothetical protein